MGKKKKQAHALGGDRGIDAPPSVGTSSRDPATDGSTWDGHIAGFRNRQTRPMSMAATSRHPPHGPGAGQRRRRTRLQEDRSHGATDDSHCLHTRPHASNSSRGARGRTSRPGNVSTPSSGRRWHNRHAGGSRRYNNNQRHWRVSPLQDEDSRRLRGGRQSQGGAQMPRSSGSQSVEETDSVADGNNSNDLDIPGFFYDAAKKKYFKIMAGQHSANSNMITRDIIKLKKAEEARQQSLREFALKTIRMDPSFRTGCVSAQKPRCHYSSNLLDHVQCMQTGAVRLHESRLVQHRVLNHQLRNLHAFCKRRVYEQECGLYQRLEHMAQMVPAPGNSARLLCLWSLEGLIVQRLQLLDVDQVALRGGGKSTVDGSATKRAQTANEGATRSLSLTPVGAVVLQSISKITHVCWAPASTEQTTDVPILYTTTCFIGNQPSLALLRMLDTESESSGTGPETTQDSPYTEFHLSHHTMWTCAWSTHKQKFSVGCRDNALVIDVATRRLWELSTKKSDVYSQAFNNQDGNTLYSGTRKGSVVGHDLRSSSTYFVTSLNHRSPVCHVHLLNDDTHLIAGDFSGRLCMWDLRMRSVVLDYIGHNNEYIQLPFNVDPAESIICGVGQDCYTRVWDLQSGTLLTSVPPPYPASRDLIPSVAVYTAPHGRLDRPGVLMGIKDEVHFYAA